jgi:hypothetical protein
MDPSLTYASDLKRGIELDVVALLFLPISRMITSFIMCYCKHIELSSVDRSTSHRILFWLK